MRQSLEDRFYSRFVRGDGDECWLWMGAPTSSGYGVIKRKGKTLHAHRVSYELQVGPVPAGLCVCHHCDVRMCVRPDHLFLGTQKDNMQDAVSKGRMATGQDHGMNTHPESRLTGDRNGTHTKPHRVARGEQHGSAKLSQSDIVDIRRLAESGTSNKEIAMRYNICPQHAWRIVTKRRWKPLLATIDAAGFEMPGDRPDERS